MMIFSNQFKQFVGNKNSWMTLFVALLASFLLLSCSETKVVESGTYAGTIKKVEPEKSEIYVTLDDGGVIELYFIDETELLNDGSPADFSVLKAGQKVEITLRRTGKRLDPLKVVIQ